MLCTDCSLDYHRDHGDQPKIDTLLKEGSNSYQKLLLRMEKKIGESIIGKHIEESLSNYTKVLQEEFNHTSKFFQIKTKIDEIEDLEKEIKTKLVKIGKEKFQSNNNLPESVQKCLQSK